MRSFVERPNLSHDLAEHVRDLILDGTLPPGDRVNEVHLSAQLGVSRTPLREALMRLVSEGAVTVVPRIGFFVGALSEEEVRDLYPLRALLDPPALEMAGIPAREKLAALRALNRKLAKAKDAKEAVRVDDEWHLALVEGCPNTILIGLIQQFMWRTRRYELGLLGDRRHLRASVATHDRILDALDQGNLKAACRELAGNMSNSLEPILEWVRRHNAARAEAKAR